MDEQMQGMQPALYHRYGALDEGDEDEDEAGGGDAAAGGGDGGGMDYGGSAYGTMLAAAMQNMDLNDSGGGDGDGGSGGGGVLADVVHEREVEAEGGKGDSWSLLAHTGGAAGRRAGAGQQGPLALCLGG
jgi:hypothetical protein